MANFYKDVIKHSPKFNSTHRVSDLDLLEPKTRELVQKIIDDARAKGVELMVFETFRSQARQTELFLKKKTKLKDVGVHHYGLACDIVKKVHGQPSWDGSFAILGEMAHANAMIWGGDWGTPKVHHSFLDDDHVQRCSVGKQHALFAGTFYPDDDYDPYNE